MEIRGRDLITGLPKNIIITSSEVMEAIKEPINAIVEAIKFTLEKNASGACGGHNGPGNNAHRRRCFAERTGQTYP